MKSIICVIIIAVCLVHKSSGQRIISTAQVSAFATYVKGNNFEGSIFSSSYTSDLTGPENIPNNFGSKSVRKFTPTIEQVVLAERILQKKLRSYNHKKVWQGGSSGPVIHRRLHKYQRQYFGYTTTNIEDIIYVNANWDSYTLIDRLQDLYPRDETWKSDYSIILDGGSYHWHIEVNLNTGQLSGLGINGTATHFPLDIASHPLVTGLRQMRPPLKAVMPREAVDVAWQVSYYKAIENTTQHYSEQLKLAVA
ncbi:hypothetical protein [Hymenobacter volaticus]|uniref:FTP domain-containing protein n=1 Tax=Hymenobacter volaticus TaxID=2932254 RepID=A0ABY4G8Q3_9BACT|nr:hypothetical protein [Hymenobacter volaticus]UOQ67285.1 hypothetical protein MUN86_05175 [Hymenobacter volaticus]